LKHEKYKVPSQSGPKFIAKYHKVRTHYTSADP